MFGKDEYIGLSLGESVIKLARVSVDDGKVVLHKLDQHILVEEIKSVSDSEGAVSREGGAFEQENEADEVFGFEEKEEDEAEDLDLDELEEEEEDISFEDLDNEEAGEEEMASMDMVDEAESSQTNELLLYNIIMGIDPKKVNLGLNIPTGQTIFQIIRDTDFSEVKQKDLISDLEDKLESIYGVAKSDDYYSYQVREDGTLLLASIEEESPMLRLVNSAREFYSGKMNINEILPDEAALIGLVNSNYALQPDEITAIIQFSETRTRTIFLKGNELWQISPIISEGSKNSNVLNTVFSKILFQLDTGEVPNLDRIILANNLLGEEAVDFFQQNFSDIPVQNFTFNDEKFDFQNLDPDQARSFTTAIATAWAASGYEKEAFPDISFVPSYVVDRQKIFKLQWHGVLLLFLIFISPLTFNYFYQQSAEKINSLSKELEQINSQLAQVTPTAESTNQISEELGILREKLVLLDTLSQGSREWSTKLDVLNEGVGNVGSTWFESMAPQQDGVFLQGYTLYRNRIPKIVEVFHEATLLNVNTVTQRGQEVFSFSVMVKEFVQDKEKYSPPKSDDLKEILNK